jgi:phosphatidylglycerol:prolipoprotein diacylglycerol transferase
VHSVAFQFGSFTIYWYGILTATGFLMAFWAAGRRAPRDGIAPDAIAAMAPWLIGGAVIGARSLYVASYWQQDFAGRPLWEIFNVRSGLVFYGGLMGASLATVFYARLNKLPLWKLADILAPSIALGHAFGRIGCLMTGCCYGRACQLPWAIHFPKEHATGGVGVHPTQIYESLLNFALFFALDWFHRRKKFDGHVFSVYLMAYAVLRALVESFRGDYPAYYFGMVTPAQLVSVGIFSAGLILFFFLGNGRKRKGSGIEP